MKKTAAALVLGAALTIGSVAPCYAVQPLAAASQNKLYLRNDEGQEQDAGTKLTLKDTANRYEQYDNNGKIVQATVDGKVSLEGHSLYRGIIQKITRQENGCLLTLERAEGTNYGAKTLMVELPNSARRNFTSSSLEKGRYLEIFYEDPADKKDARVEASAANLLPDADICIFNGAFVGYDTNGSLVMRRHGEEGVTIFHLSDATKLLTQEKTLKEDQELSIFFSGAMTRSLPPQATAKEIRDYYNPDQATDN